ncbi:Endoplasmic reticulum-Golgi intermediate compartment protein 3 [Hondaea fermentalgiana]|uniref:Endoplasmic reticulum-Golgi intermediate compartment protein 3 n=1 Tax=Hondaea fermentalgiana TaxID=2315210 RepID=A0A2R5G313_9STRA|nr:Endoplasmic reticulum-Golgi intermediate compartment protein 3 [Hondaea fermentalgiana]|eukprot:GBG25416.1 Endoplasmic reticulum-Golgi intermediate compartment protein 3 [Hondaea fermentalgiana]
MKSTGLSLRRGPSVKAAGSGKGLLDADLGATRRKLARFDLLPKVEHDVEVRTSSGGIVSMVTAALVLVLVMGELRTYISAGFTEKIEVDTTLREKLQINVNLTFHALACSQVELIAMDTTGEHHVDMDASVEKIAVSHGSQKEKNAAKAACNDCFGAGDPGRCCNTCTELLEAYIEMNWDVEDILSKAPQCEHEREQGLEPLDILDSARAPDHGCNVAAVLQVNKVGGNFHVALGHGKSVQGRLLHQFSPAQLPFFNTSHTIHELWFGSTKLPHAPQPPLESRSQIIDPHMAQTGAFQYFIEIVPTEHHSKRFYQYTSTEQFTLIGESVEKIEERRKEAEKEEKEARAREEAAGPDAVDDDGTPLVSISEKRRHARTGHGHAQPAAISQLPGVFFVYDVSPFTIVRVDRIMSMTQLLVDLLAIVGGTVAFSKFLDGSLAKVLCKGI